MIINYQKIIQNVVVVLVLVALYFSFTSGFNDGRDIARTKYVSETSKSMLRGFDYFFSDQGRYPTDSEYKNSELMKNYFNVFPPLSFSSEVCEQSYTYSSYRQLSFQLDFCIPRSKDYYVKGVNSVTEKTPFK